jgi:hypothetical protein
VLQLEILVALDHVKDRTQRFTKAAGHIGRLAGVQIETGVDDLADSLRARVAKIVRRVAKGVLGEAANEIVELLEAVADEEKDG